MKPRIFCLALMASALATPAFLAPSKAAAQGCSLCRDATAGSAPQARKALSRAIPLLGVPALTIFAGAFILAKRIKPGGSDNGEPASW